jgi:hypothetical protein
MFHPQAWCGFLVSNGECLSLPSPTLHLFSLTELCALGDLILHEMHACESRDREINSQSNTLMTNRLDEQQEQHLLQSPEQQDAYSLLTSRHILFEMRMNFFIACIKQNVAAHLIPVATHLLTRKVSPSTKKATHHVSVLDRVFESLSKEFHDLSTFVRTPALG